MDNHNWYLFTRFIPLVNNWSNLDGYPLYYSLLVSIIYFPTFSPPLSNVSYFTSLQLTSSTNATLWLLLVIIPYVLSSASSIISLWSLVQFFVLTTTISCFAIFCLNVCTYEFCFSSFLHHLQTDLCNCLLLLSCHLRILNTLLVP